MSTVIHVRTTARRRTMGRVRAWMRLVTVPCALAVATSGVSLLLASRDAASQASPDRTIRLVVSVPAGSAGDVMARVVANALAPELGQPVIVDNRAGADGIIAVRQVAAAPPDGQTLLFGFGSQFAINPVLYASLPYDAKRDLVPVTLVAHQVAAIAVDQALPVASVRALVDYSRSHPDTVNYGTSTSTFMLMAESFKQQTGADMLHVPFSGSPQMLTALLSGAIQVAFTTVQGLSPQLKSGKFRVLAVSGAARVPQLPDVPTFSEVGLLDDVPVWTAVFAPAGTPASTVGALNKAIVNVLRQPSVREQFEATAQTVVGSTPGELADVVSRDLVRMDAVVKRSGLPKR